MCEEDIGAANAARQKRQALSRWENDGGAWRHGRANEPVADETHADAAPPLSNAELVQMRMRIIALENVVIALLAHAPQCKLDLVRDMAAYISPRPGVTLHPMTIRAAAEMVSLIERAGHFRTPSA